MRGQKDAFDHRARPLIGQHLARGQNASARDKGLHEPAPRFRRISARHLVRQHIIFRFVTSFAF
jgi:hypothetical protein